MAYHPANLALRFLLELAALAGAARWAYGATVGSSAWVRVGVGLLVALLLATVWGVFAVPGDPSRSGGAPVPTPGPVRLGLEIAIFVVGAYGFFASGARGVGLGVVALIVLHHALSAERIRWLLGV